MSLLQDWSLAVCPICKSDCRFEPVAGADRLRYHCFRCGGFVIGGSLDAQFRADQISHYLLAGAVRAATVVGEKVELLHESDAKAMEKRSPATVEGRAQHLLKMFGRMMEHPASTVDVNHEIDYALVYGRNSSEFEYFFDYLMNLGFVEVTYKSPPMFRVRVTMEGWKRIEADRASGVDSDQGFVAMWFADEMNEVYSLGIAPGIEDAGFKPKRIDEKQDNGKICDEIIAEIRASRFLVADFTGGRGGVYFEAGFAMGLGIQVVWLCRKGKVRKLHFDTRQYRHIVWDTPESLRIQLRNRIRATIGVGPGTR